MAGIGRPSWSASNCSQAKGEARGFKLHNGRLTSADFDLTLAFPAGGQLDPRAVLYRLGKNWRRRASTSRLCRSCARRRPTGRWSPRRAQSSVISQGTRPLPAPARLSLMFFGAGRFLLQASNLGTLAAVGFVACAGLTMMWQEKRSLRTIIMVMVNTPLRSRMVLKIGMEGSDFRHLLLLRSGTELPKGAFAR
jgi:hypothetical protein